MLAYEWVEQLKLPPEIVMMLIQHMIATRGVQFSFKEAQKLATELSAEQITTIEAAETLFSRSEAAWKGARRVLARMSKRRSPTLDEIDLYVKWTTEWGFAPKAVEAACAEMTSGDPSFKYLDGILNGLRTRSGGKTRTAADVQKQIEGERDESANVREMLAAFGMKEPVVDEGKRLIYRSMRELAEHDVIVLAARTAGKSKRNKSLEVIAPLLASWNDKGLKTAADVERYLADVNALNNRLRALFALAGRDEAGCTQPNRELLTKWRDTWRMPDALVDVAAELSKNVDRPMPYMDKLLSVWRDEGISTVEGAREANARFVESVKKKQETGTSAAKKVNMQKYEQRSYDDPEMDSYSPEQIEEMKAL